MLMNSTSHLGLFEKKNKTELITLLRVVQVTTGSRAAAFTSL